MAPHDCLVSTSIHWIAIDHPATSKLFTSWASGGYNSPSAITNEIFFLLSRKKWKKNRLAASMIADGLHIEISTRKLRINLFVYETISGVFCSPILASWHHTDWSIYYSVILLTFFFAALSVSFNSKMSESNKLTPVQEFYKGKTLFITGGSGFMGKVSVTLNSSRAISTIFGAFWANRKTFNRLSSKLTLLLQVLVEKLLYSCSELKEILILVRPKKGKAPESRLEDMFKLPVSCKHMH